MPSRSTIQVKGKERGKNTRKKFKKRKKKSEISFKKMNLNDIVINNKTLAAIGISLPEDIKSKAKTID